MCRLSNCDLFILVTGILLLTVESIGVWWIQPQLTRARTAEPRIHVISPAAGTHDTKSHTRLFSYPETILPLLRGQVDHKSCEVHIIKNPAEDTDTCEQ